MFILTTEEGYAYHDTDGLPWIRDTPEEIKDAAIHGPFPLTNWMAFEVTQEEGAFIFQNAWQSVFGWRENKYRLVDLLK